MNDPKFRYTIELPAGFLNENDPVIVETKIVTLLELEQGRAGIINHSMVKILSRDQYTGLRDRNGTEIYRGDIVRRWHNGGGQDYRSKNYSPHSVKAVEWITLYHHVGWNISEGRDGNTKWEVIGTVQNNPDLVIKMRENSSAS